MLEKRCVAIAQLIFAPRICRAHVLGNQVWYVFPNGRCADSWVQAVSAAFRMADGDALDSWEAKGRRFCVWAHSVEELVGYWANATQ